MTTQDIRWIQRLKNYKKALLQLEEAVQLMESRELSNIEKQGVIQAFEFTHELSWQLLKDFLSSKGHTDVYGSRDAVKKAFSLELLSEGEVWMQMIKSRNLTSHTYNEGTAEEILKLIQNDYYPAFQQLMVTMNKLEQKELI